MNTNKSAVSSVDDATVAKTAEQGRRLLARGPLATAARYESGRIHVELNNGCAFEFPVAQAQGLAGAKIADLRVIQIQAAGLGLHWPKLDADLYVPALVKGVLGTKLWMAAIGASGGRVVTAAKSSAARANGKLGGRPKARNVLQAAFMTVATITVAVLQAQGVGFGWLFLLLAIGNLIATFGKVAIDAVDRRVELAIGKPADVELFFFE